MEPWKEIFRWWLKMCGEKVKSWSNNLYHKAVYIKKSSPVPCAHGKYFLHPSKNRQPTLLQHLYLQNAWETKFWIWLYKHSHNLETWYIIMIAWYILNKFLMKRWLQQRLTVSKWTKNCKETNRKVWLLKNNAENWCHRQEKNGWWCMWINKL